VVVPSSGTSKATSPIGHNGSMIQLPTPNTQMATARSLPNSGVSSFTVNQGTRPELPQLPRQQSMNGVAPASVNAGSSSWQYMAALQPPSDYIEKLEFDSDDEDIEKYSHSDGEEGDGDSTEPSTTPSNLKGEKKIFMGPSLNDLTGVAKTSQSNIGTGTGEGEVNGDINKKPHLTTHQETFLKKQASGVFRNISFRKMSNALGLGGLGGAAPVHTDVEAGPSSGAHASFQGRTDVRTTCHKDGCADHDHVHTNVEAGAANYPNDVKSADTKAHSTDITTGPNPNPSTGPAPISVPQRYPPPIGGGGGNEWSYGKEQFELIKTRVKFFFEDDDSKGMNEVVLQATTTLFSVAQKLSALPHTNSMAHIHGPPVGGHGPAGAGLLANKRGSWAEKNIQLGNGQGASTPASGNESGHLLIVRAENLPKPTVIGDDSKGGLKTVYGGLQDFLSVALDTTSIKADMYPCPFIALEPMTPSSGGNPRRRASQDPDMNNPDHPDNLDSRPYNPHSNGSKCVLQLQQEELQSVKSRDNSYSVARIKPSSDNLNSTENPDKPDESDKYAFGGMALVSYQDSLSYLSAGNRRLKGLHPVDALVHGILEEREFERTEHLKGNPKGDPKGKKAGKIKVKADDRKKTKQNEVDGVGDLDTVAVGVVVRGSLSVLDERQYRMATAVAIGQ